MFEQLVFIILGLSGLFIGADFLIRGAKNIAEHFGIPHIIIGLAFISIGTSIPELAVSVSGGLNRLSGIETSGIVFGNALGSVLTLITLLVGILAFLVHLRLDKETVRRQGLFLIAAVLMVFALAFDGELTRLDGIILVFWYFVYYISLWSSHIEYKKGRRVTMHTLKDITYVVVGIMLVLFTSNIVVESGIHLAEVLGVSQSLIGILLVGVGTGLPELSVVLTGFRRNAVGISMGDLIGSNICDLLFSLGIGTTIAGFTIDPVNVWFDLPVLFFFCLTVLYFLYSGRGIARWEGGTLIVMFLIYSIAKIFVTG